MYRQLLLLTVSVFLFFTSHIEAVAAQEEKSSLPDWIVERNFDPLFEPDRSLNGLQTLLADMQFGLIEGQKIVFNRFAVRAMSQSAAQEISYFQAQYIQDYQKLQLHRVYIWRDGTKIDVTNRLVSKSNILQSGGMLDSDETTIQQIYFVPDVKRGDVVEYALSIIGVSPAFKGQMSGIFPSYDMTRAGTLTRSLVAPEDIDINIKLLGEHPEPTRSLKNGLSYYSWEIDSAETEDLELEFFAPQWLSQIPLVQYSSYSNWSDIADWATSLFLDGSMVPDLRNVAYELGKQGMSEMDQLKSVYGFMQSDIRYVGVELGRNGYIPFDPETVLQRRFGDCKDQAILMIHLLKTLGIEAHPALVNSNGANWIDENFPTSLSFNHLIVVVELGGKRYWLDPTLGTETPDKVSLKNPPYGKALIVRPGETGLVDIPRDIPENGGFHIETADFFGLDALFGSKGKVGLTRRYYGEAANIFRQQRWDGDDEAIVNHFKEVLSKKADEVEELGTPEIFDYPEENEFHFIGDFRISGLAEDRGKKLRARLQADEIQRFLIDLTLSDKPRRMPIAIPHPLKIKQVQRVFLPETFELDLDNYERKSPYHQFTATRSKSKNGIIMVYEYETLKDMVPVEDVDAYLDDISFIKDHSDYFFSINKRSNAFKPKTDLKPPKLKIDIPKIDHEQDKPQRQ